MKASEVDGFLQNQMPDGSIKKIVILTKLSGYHSKPGPVGKLNRTPACCLHPGGYGQMC